MFAGRDIGPVFLGVQDSQKSCFHWQVEKKELTFAHQYCRRQAAKKKKRRGKEAAGSLRS